MFTSFDSFTKVFPKIPYFQHWSHLCFKCVMITTIIIEFNLLREVPSKQAAFIHELRIYQQNSHFETNKEENEFPAVDFHKYPLNNHLSICTRGLFESFWATLRYALSQSAGCKPKLRSLFCFTWVTTKCERNGVSNANRFLFLTNVVIRVVFTFV